MWELIYFFQKSIPTYAQKMQEWGNNGQNGAPSSPSLLFVVHYLQKPSFNSSQSILCLSTPPRRCPPHKPPPPPHHPLWNHESNRRILLYELPPTPAVFGADGDAPWLRCHVAFLNDDTNGIGIGIDIGNVNPRAPDGGTAESDGGTAESPRSNEGKTSRYEWESNQCSPSLHKCIRDTRICGSSLKPISKHPPPSPTKQKSRWWILWRLFCHHSCPGRFSSSK